MFGKINNRKNWKHSFFDENQLNKSYSKSNNFLLLQFF